jgi:hypothetical protein
MENINLCTEFVKEKEKPRMVLSGNGQQNNVYCHMYYQFENVDRFLFSIEKEIVDILFEYKLLSKLNKDVKKIIFYYFVKKIGDKINNNRNLLFFHDNSFSDDHELFQHYDKEKLTIFINKICVKLKKVTNKLFFLKKKIDLPQQALINELEGSVIDQVLLLSLENPVDPKKLKSFLEENSLKDLFTNLSKKVC